MKILLVLLLGLCTVLSARADEQLCGGSVNCTCDPSKYTAALTPPNAVITCPNGQMIIYISKCQLEKNLFNSSNLALQQYTGVECASNNYLVNGEIQVGFHNPLSTTKCGNNITVNSTHITYSNTLHIYAAARNIVTRSNYNESLSCSYPLTYPVQLNVTLKPIVKVVSLTIPGVNGQVDLTMAAYTESSFTDVVTDNTNLYVGDTIYIQIWMPQLEAGTFSIKVLRLYATPGGSTPADGLVFNLTSGPDGCPDPQYGSLITILQNGNSSESRYALQVFQITGQPYVNLYADVTICPSACPSNCQQRSIEVSPPDNVATMNVQLSANGDMYSGASHRLSLSSTLVFLTSILLFVKLM